MEKINFFNRHLVETGENYFEHFLFAFATAMWILITGAILVVHSICPFLFCVTSSTSIRKVNEVMQKRRAVLAKRIEDRNKEALTK